MNRMKKLAAAGLFWLSALTVRADAPYVVAGANGLEAWTVSGEGKVAKQAVAAGSDIEIAGVGPRPAFHVRLREPVPVAADELSWPQGCPVFVMADSHGEFVIATELLQRHGVIDADLKWAYGRGHLVILGDVFDRGPNQTDLFWLFYKLEAEAAAAGGAVHLNLGNHETMALTGLHQYLNPTYLETAKQLGVAGYSELWSKETLLGQWLRAKPSVFKLGRVLFLHGGISADAVAGQWTVARMNATVRAWLNGEKSKDDPQVAFIRGPLGPLWYRGYFPKYRTGKQGSPEEIEAIKVFYGVDRLAIGHTIVTSVTPLYEGAVIAVQVYPVRAKDTGVMNMEGVLIRSDGDWHRAKIDGSVEPLSLTLNPAPTGAGP